MSASGFPEPVVQRAKVLFAEEETSLHRQTDRLFAGLLVFQWLACIAVALAFSPRAWQGTESSVHPHVYAAIFVGAALALPACALVWKQPGCTSTRHAIALCQALFSALLIHITGGRIESHFHIFGSLAFLAFYRDWRVLLSASAIIAADHAVRGLYWPASVYGMSLVQPWRFVEHAGWIVFEDTFLIASTLRSTHKLRALSLHQAGAEASQARVEAQVQERTLELARARDQALEASRQKSEFLANMSHEIRTPMNGILAMTEALIGSGLTRQQAEQAQTVRSCSSTLLAMLSDMLDLSKLESGKLVLDELDLNLFTLGEELRHVLLARAQAKGLAFELKLLPGVPHYVRGDPLRLRQVLLNLGDNAIKFTEHGWVAIEIELVPSHTAGCRLRFRVRDSGIGIQEELRGHLFRAFSQLDASSTRKHGGGGLGLVISQRLVESMGGRLCVESTVGVGSTFWFELEFKPASAGADEPKAALPLRAIAPSADPRRLRVLIVEDNPVNLRVLQSMLQRLGHTCLSAGNGETGLAAIELEQPDLVLMDCQMPVLDGYEATRELRRRERGERHQIVIAVTANALLGDREDCLAAGMDDYLSKPVEAKSLAAMIELWRARMLPPVPST